MAFTSGTRMHPSCTNHAHRAPNVGPLGNTVPAPTIMDLTIREAAVVSGGLCKSNDAESSSRLRTSICAGILLASAVGQKHRQDRWRQKKCHAFPRARFHAQMNMVGGSLETTVSMSSELDLREAADSVPSSSTTVFRKPQRAYTQKAPWLKQYLPRKHVVSDESESLLLSFLAALEDRGIKLYTAQQEAIVEIFSGAHVVLDTPTGSGKSLVAVAALFKAIAEGKRAYYTSPTKALVSEKFFDLCELFGADYIGMATGDVSVNSRGGQVVCCTAEVLTSISLYDGIAASADYVVMDEFHYYGDGARGAAWEIPLWRLPQSTFLLMSGTLGVNSELYSAIESCTGRRLSVVSSQERPVPLKFAFSHVSIRSTVERLVEEDKYPAYIVHFSQREALETARDFAKDPACSQSDVQRAKLRSIILETDFNSPFGPELQKLLLSGIGVHHAGLLPKYRRLVERLAQASLLNIVCGTDTLGVGINVPIRSVLFTRLCKFDGEETRILRSREFHQIAGRAGRKGFDDEGDVVAVPPAWIVFNNELQEKLKQGHRVQPKWKRPPRKNFKNWTPKTFNMLQQKAPDRLKSHFRLSMGQVYTVLQGAHKYRRDGLLELRELVDRAQCSNWERRVVHQEVNAYMEALAQFGLACEEQDEEEVISPERLQTDIGSEQSASMLDGQSCDMVGRREEQNVSRTSSSQEVLLSDSSSLYIIYVMPLLEQEVHPEEFATSVLAAIESVCDAPGPIMRALGPRQKSLHPLSHLHDTDSDTARSRAVATEDVEFEMPAPFEDLLMKGFNSFLSRNPWVSHEAVQPKGILTEMVSDDLSFAELATRLTSYSHTDAAITAEGALLRYIADVYRVMRLSVPEKYKTLEVQKLETKLRTVVTAVDSSLVQEWESLRESKVETKDTDEPNTLNGSGEADNNKGAMIPRGQSVTERLPAASPEELKKRILDVRLRLTERHIQRQAAERKRKMGLMSRGRRWWGTASDVAQQLWHTFSSIIW